MKDLDLAFNRLIRRYVVTAALLLLGLLGVSIIWNNSIKQELADQATLFLRKTLQAGDTRGELQIMNGIRFASFQSITQYDSEGRRIVTLPPTVAPIEYRNRSLWDRLLHAEVRSVIRLDDERETQVGALSFIYSRFELAGYAILVWIFVVALIAFPFTSAKRRLSYELEKELAFQNSKILKDLVGKVRHNIRSPLAVLNAYFTATSTESLALKDQGHRAAHRIEEILSEMEGGGEPVPQAVPSPTAIFDAVALARQILEEKSLLQSSALLEIKSNSPCAYTRISGPDLKATLSNLLDNALQAIGSDGRIEIDIEADGSMVAVSIQDNGKGIAPELLPKVREKGFTHGKENGSGLGLYYAEKLMEEAQGGLTIESELGKGTTVSLMFPQEPTPTWYCDSLVVPKDGTLFICDDQPYMLQAWQIKLPKAIRTRFFGAAEDLPAASEIGPSDRFLIDHDFGKGKRTGLAAIRELPNPAHAVLVTGRAYEAEIQTECVTAGCKLLSKDLIVSFPVTTA
ncbi:MAG: HAMP domain-containing histidine kinase [Bdellovibrionaceae bacterium]|nr:HAMP domain-containing histidine kinase [Pseudobdellovibrionaceae bacterium]